MTMASPAPPAVAPPRGFTFLWKEALVILAGIIVLRVGGGAGAMLIGCALILWSLRSGTAALQALTLMLLFSLLSFHFAPRTINTSLKWLTVLVGSFAAIFHCWRSYGLRLAGFPRWLLAFLLFVLVTGCLALISSRNPDVSIFKLITFTVGTLGLMAIFWNRHLSLRYAFDWLFTLFAVVVLLSAPLLLLPMGYYGSTHYFRGIIWISQSYAVYVIPFTALLVIKWISGVPMSRLERALAAFGGITVFVSNSRTCALAFLITIVVVSLMGVARRIYDGRLMLQRWLPLAVIAVLVLVLGDVMLQGRVMRRLSAFVNKGGVQVTSALGSREVKFKDAYAAFQSHLLAGVGFGANVNEKEEMQVEYERLLGLPVSAPVEAGVMYMALPAQIGLAGTVAFLFFAIIFATPITRGAPLPIVALALCALLTNLGEYTFFAIGNLGLHLWAYFAFAHRCGVEYGDIREY